MTGTPRTVSLRISGRVQGVGYRAWLMGVALRHGLRGWVRNRLDGSVEALIHGPADACDAVVTLARRGPPAARVTDVAVSPSDAQTADLPDSFDRRPTA